MRGTPPQSSNILVLQSTYSYNIVIIVISVNADAVIRRLSKRIATKHTHGDLPSLSYYYEGWKAASINHDPVQPIELEARIRGVQPTIVTIRSQVEPPSRVIYYPFSFIKDSAYCHFLISLPLILFLFVPRWDVGLCSGRLPGSLPRSLPRKTYPRKTYAHQSMIMWFVNLAACG
ncbi:hypothetical protein K445DRAFT_82242 [Daldinia sp. EC12]|nr:hypothetical protein F4774DRAFT_13058 [Daldinia eschscholtzii]OTB20268.1 hypothetical protein K445DRAFT_82242 [Daldinia sp. EC12]